MHAIVFLFTGLIVSSILVHFIFKLTMEKHCVTEVGLDGAAQLTAVLQLGNGQPAIKKMLSNGASATISLSFFGRHGQTGRFEAIKKLAEKTNKSIPEKQPNSNFAVANTLCTSPNGYCKIPAKGY